MKLIVRSKIGRKLFYEVKRIRWPIAVVVSLSGVYPTEFHVANLKKVGLKNDTTK